MGISICSGNSNGKSDDVQSASTLPASKDSWSSTRAKVFTSTCLAKMAT